jgi:hypothetical protein
VLLDDLSTGRAITRLFGPSDDVIEPDPGYVFVYTYDDNQVFDQNDNAVQVPETFANS